VSWSTAPRFALALAAVIRSFPLAAQGLREKSGIAGSLTLPTSFDHQADTAGDGLTPGVSGLAVVDLKLPKTPVGIRSTSVPATTPRTTASRATCPPRSVPRPTPGSGSRASW